GVEVGAQVGGGAGEGGGHRGGVGQLVAAGGRGPGRVPHGAGGQLGGDGHVGAVVLHRLERADGPAELDPLLGVGGGRVGAGAGQPDGLGGQDDPGQVDEQPAGAGQDGGRGAVEGDPGRPAGGVEVGCHLDGHALTPLDE